MVPECTSLLAQGHLIGEAGTWRNRAGGDEGASLQVRIGGADENSIKVLEAVVSKSFGMATGRHTMDVLRRIVGSVCQRDRQCQCGTGIME